MATDNINDLVELFESNLSPLKLLLADRQPISAWADLAPDLVLESLLPDPAKQLRPYHETEVVRLARRVILGRDADLFESLIPLWRNFGETKESCTSIRTAIEQCVTDWEPAIYRHVSSSVQFSPAHYEFVVAMKAVASRGEGVFSAAIGNSRIDRIEQHPGFPMVLPKNNALAFQPSYWVHFSHVAAESSSERVDLHWSKVSETVRNEADLTRTGANILPKLPQWLHDLDTHEPVGTLASATLSCLMYQLAKTVGQPLPFGIGFTGDIADGRLKAVAGVEEKIKAAKSAGIFLFFACDEKNGEGLTKIPPGLQVVLLPDGLLINETVKRVNQVCAETGLTEYRWRQALDPQLRFQPLSFTPSLPNAVFKPDPRDHSKSVEIPFVGEKTRLAKLSALVDEGPTKKTRLMFVVGAQREGKTTLLSEFARRQMMYPCWFSFRAVPSGGDSRKQLATALAEQLKERYVVVSRTPIESLAESLSSFSYSSPLLIVDGLDEAGEDGISGDDTLADAGVEQSLRYLGKFDPNISILIGTQERDCIPKKQSTRLELPTSPDECGELTKELIARYAHRWASNDVLAVEAKKLDQPNWIEAFQKFSSNNLWVVSSYLDGIEAARGGLPDSPSELASTPLNGDPKEYFSRDISDVANRYPLSQRDAIERFIAARSYLDNSNWPVSDVLRLADLSESDMSNNWRTGPVCRLIVTDGIECRFRSELVRESVRQHYPTASVSVFGSVKRLIEANDTSRLGEFAVYALCGFLSAVPFAEVFSTIKNSNWLSHRLCLSLRDAKSIDPAILEISGTGRFASNAKASGEVRLLSNLLEWLNAWRTAIEETPSLIADWVSAGGHYTQSFRQRTPTESRLVCPTQEDGTAATYPIASAKRFFFPGEMCFLYDCGRKLLTVSGLYCLHVFEQSEYNISSIKRIPLPNNRSITHLAAGTFPIVYATTTVSRRWPPSGIRDTIYAVNINDASFTEVVQVQPNIRIRGCLPIQSFIVVACFQEQYESSLTKVHFKLYDQHGTCLDSNWLTINYQHRMSTFEESHFDLIPWGDDGFAVFAGDNFDGQKLFCYRFEENSLVELDLDDTSCVHGVMVGPDRSLVWTQPAWDENENRYCLINVLKSRSDEVIQVTIDYQDLREPSSTVTREDPQDETAVAASKPVSVFSKIYPVGWQDKGTILLHLEDSMYSSSDFEDRCYSIAIEPESLPQRCRYNLEKHIEYNWPDTDLVASVVGPDGCWFRIYDDRISCVDPLRLEPLSVKYHPARLLGELAESRVLVREFDDNSQSYQDFVHRPPPCKLFRLEESDWRISQRQGIRIHGSEVIGLNTDNTSAVWFDAAKPFLGWGPQTLERFSGFSQLIEEHPQQFQQLWNWIKNRPRVVVQFACLASSTSLWTLVQTEEHEDARYFLTQTRLHESEQVVIRLIQVDLHLKITDDDQEPLVSVETTALSRLEPNLQFSRVDELDDLEPDVNRSSSWLVLKASTHNVILLEAKVRQTPGGISSSYFVVDSSEGGAGVEIGSTDPVVLVLENECLKPLENNHDSWFFGSKTPWTFCDSDASMVKIFHLGNFACGFVFATAMESVNAGERRWRILNVSNERNGVRGFCIDKMILTYNAVTGKCVLRDVGDFVLLDGEAECVEHCDGFIAIGFKSGRIEIRKASKLHSVFRYCFTSESVRKLSFRKVEDRLMLAAFDGELMWFEIKD